MHSTRLHGLINYPNDIPLADLQMGSYLEWWIGLPPPGLRSLRQLHQRVGLRGMVEQALRPFPQYGYINEDSYLQNVGQASYDALTAKVERRFHNGSISWALTHSPRR